MPIKTEITTIPELWDTLFAADSLTITVTADNVQAIKLALSRYKSKRMAKLKGQIESLTLQYTATRTPETPSHMVCLRIDLVRSGSKIEHAGIVINDTDMENF